jgi:hypothetical protein
MSDQPHETPARPPDGALSQPSREVAPPRLDALHLLVTYRCTYACDHCFVWGSPEQEGTMTLAQLCRVIDQGVAAGCTTIYFEGGEPMLVYPVLLAAARHAREAGLEVGIVTNCFWAESLDDALVWLAPFAELGIADLAVSSYAYFTENLESETHLRNAVVAARQLGLPPAVLEVGAPESLTTCPYEDFADPGRCHVGCDGNLMPCQGISIGNLWQRPLTDVLATHDPASLPVVREIAAGGPWALARAEGLEPARPLYADECHLCYELRGRLRAAGRHLEVLAPDQCYGVHESPAR